MVASGNDAKSLSATNIFASFASKLSGSD